MEPASAEKLLKAFQILDSEGKGTLSKEYTSKLMSEEGEPFTQVSKLLLFTFFKFQTKRWKWPKPTALECKRVLLIANNV